MMYVGNTYRFRGASLHRDYGDWIATKIDGNSVWGRLPSGRELLMCYTTDLNQSGIGGVTEVKALPDETEAFFV